MLFMEPPSGERPIGSVNAGMEGCCEDTICEGINHMNQERSMTREERMRRRERIRRKKRRRFIRKLRNSCILTLCFLIFAVILWNVGSFILKGELSGIPIFSANTAAEVKRPVERTEKEVIEHLQALAKKNKDYKNICENADAYPAQLLAALANNPEMLDFVKGYLENDGVLVGELTKREKKQDYPLFLQWDSRWGYSSYGSSNIGLSGCGPTCLSMAAYSLTRDADITPAKVAAYSESQGFYVEGTGTSWSLMTEGAAAFGITGTELPLDEDRMKQALDAGHPIICAMAAGDFTTAGHFIMIYGYDKKGFHVNDPNCIARSEKIWTYEELRPQIKNLWYYQ